MSTYEPGTVAVATVRGVPNVRVFRIRDHHEIVRWVTADNLNGWLGHHDSDVTDVRPLVVLDLDSNVNAERVWLFIEEIKGWIRSGAVENQTGGTAELDAITDAIRAALPPPRIPEPGWGEQVIAHIAGFEANRERWVAVKDGPCQWWHSESGRRYAWSDLVDPERAS